MIIPAQTLRRIRPVEPFEERGVIDGMSYGLSHAGYDIRIREDVELEPGGFTLASTIERFRMPNDVAAMVCDKSTWARRGLAVQNTFIEPGWEGYLTLELSNNRHVSHERTMHVLNAIKGQYLTSKAFAKLRDDANKKCLRIAAGSPIAQIVFFRLEEATERPYAGKYQHQEAGPQEARLESADEKAPPPAKTSADASRHGVHHDDA